MERTPKSGNKISLSLSGTDEKRRPDNSTPETSTSRHVRKSYSEEISPVESPEWSEQLSQRVYWRWKSPDASALKCINVRRELTPKAEYKYSPPKPKRKLIHHNSYTENLSKLAEEFKSLQEHLKGPKENSLREKNEVKENKSQENIPENISAIRKPDAEELSVENAEALLSEEVHKDVSQDILVVEVTQGLTSLKSFPPNHEFPKVPKLDIENDMNKSDFIILMEDKSIEDEMIKCTQQIEEQILKAAARSEKNNISTSASNNKVINSFNKFANYVKSPRSVNSPLRNSRNPSIIDKLSSGRKCMSPKNGHNSNLSKEKCGVVCWDSAIMDVKSSESKEEEVSCLFEDDSFDNIILELVVETEKSSSPPEVSRSKENECTNVGDERTCKNGENTDSFGMLEDDSIIQPDVLNFLDAVENQAVAASQPIKCTPEEIQKKKIEAKKKLAVGKRKRSSEMACRLSNPDNKTKGLVNS